jgi:type I restriction enzyme S subunit
VRERWNSKPLGQVAAFLNGLWKGKKPPYVTVGVIRNTNFAKDGSIDDSDIARLEVEAKQFEKRKLKFGDIILEKSGGGPKQPVGRVALFVKEDGNYYAFSNFTSAIRVNDPKELDFRFLHKFLFWKYASGVTEAMQNHSTGIRNLNTDAYKDMVVPLPPLPEQQRIVAILDEAFAGLATATSNTQKNLKNARELFDSHLSSAFDRGLGSDWKTRALSELTDKDTPITYGVVKPGPEGDVTFVRGGDLSDGEVLVDQLRTITRAISDQYKRTLLRGGEILISLVGQPGQVGIVPPALAGANIARQVGLIRLRPDNDSKFVSYFLRSPLGQKSLGAYQGGSVQQVINLADLRLVEVPLPNLHLQKEIANRLDEVSGKVRSLSKSYERKIAVLAELKQSVLQRAFSGELISPPSQAIEEAAE